MKKGHLAKTYFPNTCRSPIQQKSCSSGPDLNFSLAQFNTVALRLVSMWVKASNLYLGSLCSTALQSNPTCLPFGDAFGKCVVLTKKWLASFTGEFVFADR